MLSPCGGTYCNAATITLNLLWHSRGRLQHWQIDSKLQARVGRGGGRGHQERTSMCMMPLCLQLLLLLARWLLLLLLLLLRRVKAAAL